VADKKQNYLAVQATIQNGGLWYGKPAMSSEDTSVGFKTRAFLIAFFYNHQNRSFVNLGAYTF